MRLRVAVFLPFLVVFFILTLTASSHADHFHDLIAIDNDTFFPGCGAKENRWCANEDAWYSQGFLYESRHKKNNPNSHPNFKIPLLNFQTNNFSVGQKIFTPDFIESFSILENDRPFAGWLFISFFKEKISDLGSNKASFIRKEIIFGILGPYAFGDIAQNGWHAVFTELPILVRGWKNQIGTEPGFIASYEKKGVLWQHRQSFADLNWATKVRLGNIFTDGSVGGSLRMGKLHPAFSSFNFENAYYFKLGFDLKAVVYDATFQGGLYDRFFYNSQNSPHTFNYNDLMPFVGTMEFGGVIGFCKGKTLGFSVIVRSKEFRKQSFEHSFGRITFASVH